MKWESYNTKGITEKYLLKFISLQNFEQFIKTGKIWFSRADVFGDKMECVTIDDLIKKNPYKSIEIRKKLFLISCWHLSNVESLALWDTYAENIDLRRILAIRFKRSDLIDLFYTQINQNSDFDNNTLFIHGRIKYRDLINRDNSTLNNNRIKYPAFRKEAAFKYESEYRFIINTNNIYNEKRFGFYIGDVRKLPFEIIINPLLKSNVYNKVNQKILDWGYKSKLRQSILFNWLRPDQW